MKFNGYMLKDREEELKHKAGRIRNKLGSLNSYYEKDAARHPELINKALVDYRDTLIKLTKLSSLQMYYNITVIDDEGVTLHELIKMQEADKSYGGAWSSLEAAQSIGIYDSSYRRTETDIEYKQYYLEKETCANAAEAATSNIRSRRGKIRTLNAVMIDIPDGKGWDKVFTDE